MSDKSKSISSKNNFEQDERLKKVSKFRTLLNRPELGALGGSILVFIFFGIVAGDTGMFSAYGMLNFLDVSANLGIIAIAAAMLMIGGEFDLSIGSMIGFAGICIAIPAIYWGWPLWISIFFALAMAVLIGYFNGIMVVKTGLPSFIVTLAMLFILRGATLAITRLITGRTQVPGLRVLIEDDPVAWIFATDSFKWLFSWLGSMKMIA
jgi:Ribose/xylose/arabinose/galactoside ABC-type transport systems, permease components